MLKSYLFILVSLILVLSGCGQKSVIENAVKAKTMAEAYGDGKYVIRPLVIPLSDQELSPYDSPVANIGFIFGGFAKLFMDLGASMGMGKTHISLIQAIPEIPVEYLKELKVKRIFFYIEPQKGEREHRWWQRLLKGRDTVDFKFLDKIAVKLSTHNLDAPNNWKPLVEIRDMNGKEFGEISELFKAREQIYSRVIDSREVQDLVLLRYNGRHKDRYLKNDEFGKVFLLNSESPAKVKRFFLDHPKMQGYFKRIHILNKSLLVELEKDPVVEESFKLILSESTSELESLKVSMIEPCTKKTCMDLKVQDVNLLPLIMKGNAIKLDAFINAGQVPESFKLKGFIEFEVKLKLSF